MRRVRIGTGYNQILLPNGSSYNAGQEVILDDDEFNDIDADLLGVQIIDLGSITELLYGAGSGLLTLGVAGTFRATLANPAASGKILRIRGIDVFCSVATTVELRLNAASPPTGAKTESALRLGATNPAPVGVFTADTGADLAGGTALGLFYGMAAGTPRVIGSNIELSANNALSLNAPVAAAGNLTVVATWGEA